MLQTTNKRIAFYTAIIGTILSVLLPALGLHISPEQQETLITAVLLVCAAFGIGDIGFDWLNAARGNFDVKVTETKTIDSPVSPFTTEITAVEKTISLSNPPSNDKLNNDLSVAG